MSEEEDIFAAFKATLSFVNDEFRFWSESSNLSAEIALAVIWDTPHGFTTSSARSECRRRISFPVSAIGEKVIFLNHSPENLNSGTTAYTLDGHRELIF
jgi:hypothetical protein